MIVLIEPEGDGAFNEHAQNGVTAAKTQSLQKRFSVLLDQARE